MELIRRRTPRNPGVKIVKKIFLIIALLFCLVQAFQWEINFLFNEYVEVEKGSLKYYLTLPPRIVRNAPIISRLPDAKTGYSYSIGDGNAPGYEGVHYQSSESKENITTQLTKYLGEWDYAFFAEEVEKGDDGNWIRNHLRFRAPEKPETEVVVSLFQEAGKGPIGVKFTAYHW